MDLGLVTYSWHLAFGKHPVRRATGPMTLAKCLRRAKELGFAAVQIDPFHFDSEKENPRWVRTMADSLGIALEAGSMGIEPERLRRDLRLAADWGSPVVRTYLGWEYPRSRRHPSERLRAAADALRSVAGDAERLGVAIAVENHSDIATADLVALLEMADHPFVGACVDSGNSMVFFEEPAETVERLLPWAVSAHLKDMRWIGYNAGHKLASAPLGEGIVDLDRVIPLFLGAPRVGRIMLEVEAEAAGTEREMLTAEQDGIERSLAFWKDWTAKRGKK